METKLFKRIGKITLIFGIIILITATIIIINFPIVTNNPDLFEALMTIVALVLYFIGVASLLGGGGFYYQWRMLERIYDQYDKKNDEIQVKVICAQCSSDLPQEIEFCDQCGKQITEQERKEAKNQSFFNLVLNIPKTRKKYFVCNVKKDCIKFKLNRLGTDIFMSIFFVLTLSVGIATLNTAPVFVSVIIFVFSAICLLVLFSKRLTYVKLYFDTKQIKIGKETYESEEISRIQLVKLVFPIINLEGYEHYGLSLRHTTDSDKNEIFFRMVVLILPDLLVFGRYFSRIFSIFLNREIPFESKPLEIRPKSMQSYTVFKDKWDLMEKEYKSYKDTDEEASGESFLDTD